MSKESIDEILAKRAAARASEQQEQRQQKTGEAISAREVKATRSRQTRARIHEQEEVLLRLKQKFINEVGGRINLNPSFGITGSMPVVKHFTRAALLRASRQGENFVLDFKHSGKVRWLGNPLYWSDEQYKVQGHKLTVSYDPDQKMYSYQRDGYELVSTSNPSSSSERKMWNTYSTGTLSSEAEVLGVLKEAAADHIEAHKPMNRQLLVKSCVAGALVLAFSMLAGCDKAPDQARNMPVESSYLDYG